MDEWIEVNTDQASPEIEQKVRGVNVKLSASPYDVPTKVRGYRENNSDFFVIEFQHIVSGEPIREMRPSPEGRMILEVGKISKRIYKIKVDVVHFKADAVRLQIATQVEQAMEAAITQFGKNADIPPSRYEVTGQVLRSNSAALFGALT
jgi:hypothetical protein